MMHLGMSGSFRVIHGSDERAPGKIPSGAQQALGARSCGVPHVERRDRDVQRSAPLRLMKLMRARRIEPGAADRGARARAARQCVRRARCLPSPARARRLAEGSTVGPEGRGGLGNIYVCEALHRAQLSPKRQASTIATRGGGDAACRRAGRGHQGGAQRRDPRRRLVVARPSPHRRRARRLPAQFPRLRPRRDEMHHAEVQGHDPAHRAGHAVDLLLSGVSEVISTISQSPATPASRRPDPRSRCRPT